MQPELKVTVGAERMILCDGLQPFMIATPKGTVFVQAQLSFPPGYVPPPENAYPGIPGNVISRDGGKTWSLWRYKPKHDEADELKSGTGGYWDSVTTTAQVGPTFEGSAVGLRDGSVLILDWIARGPDEQGYFEGTLWESHDDLETVVGPTPWRVHLPQAKAGNDDGGHPFRAICMHRTVLEMPDGNLLSTAYGWFKGDDTPSTYRPVMSKFRSILLRSSDRGRSWHFVSTIAVDPEIGEEGFNEPVMARVSHGPNVGRLICHIRTGSNDCPIYQVISDDDGATWTAPQALPFNGVDPDLIETSDGILIGIIGRRINEEFSPDRCYQLIGSTDAGENWTLLATWNTEPYSNVDSTTYYAALREVAPGRVLVAYDVGWWGQPIRYVAGREVQVELRHSS